MAVSVLGVWIQYNAPKVQYTERMCKPYLWQGTKNTEWTQAKVLERV